MYDEWNCIVKCIEKKMEYTVLEFYSQYFNIKMHLGSIDNEFWCFFPEYNMFTELLSPIDLYKNIDILDELFKSPYESMTIAKGIKKYFETQLEEDTVESHIEKLKGHVYTNKVKVVLYDEERDVYHLIYKINRSRMNVRWLHIEEQVQIIMKYVCHLLIHWIIILDIAEY